METAAQAGRVRRSDGQEAWPQVGCQSAGEGEPRTAGCKCPLDEEAEERRVDHRGSKKSGCVVWQSDSEHPDRRGELMSAALELGQSVGQAVACRALGVPRATLYRHMQPAGPPRHRPTPERALDAAERQAVLDHLHSERFRDKAPVEVYATLLDESIYLCSIRTMHRILAQNGELKERRNQLRHPQYTKPELLATAPNQVSIWASPKPTVDRRSQMTTRTRRVSSKLSNIGQSSQTDLVPSRMHVPFASASSLGTTTNIITAESLC